MQNDRVQGGFEGESIPLDKLWTTVLQLEEEDSSIELSG